MKSFRFCPFCSQAYPSTQTENAHKHCLECNKWVFDNLKATGSAVIIRDNKLLMVKRAINPFKGFWDIPGGFCDPQEHPEQTVIRELQEELGVKGRVEKLFAVYAPVPYEYQGNTQYNCDLFYTVEPESFEFTPADDVAGFAWFALDNLPKQEEIAFISAKQLVTKLRSKT